VAPQRSRLCAVDRNSGWSRPRRPPRSVRIRGHRNSACRETRGPGCRDATRSPGCQDVLSDFTDQSGQSLSTKLEAGGTSPAEAVGSLRFFDDRRAPQCHAGMLAFTQTGSRLIRVCGRQFRDRDRATTENHRHSRIPADARPRGESPTSEAITERVAMRCSS
jgi:hypothetical protein